MQNGGRRRLCGKCPLCAARTLTRISSLQSGRRHLSLRSNEAVTGFVDSMSGVRVGMQALCYFDIYVEDPRKITYSGTVSNKIPSLERYIKDLNGGLLIPEKESNKYDTRCSII